MERISLDWSISNPCRYVGTIVLFALAIRVVLSGLRAVKLTHEVGWSSQMFFVMLRRNLAGVHPRKDGPSPWSDYWFTFILGLLELAIYPILIAINAWTVIGAWIGLKALAQWDVWGKDRATFNLFLIGNALNVVISYLALSHLVTVPD